MKKILFFILILLVACTTIPYNDDVGFMVSAQAESPELPIYLNGKMCTDMDGTPGLCTMRIKSDQDLVITADPKPYAYTMEVSCTSQLGESGSFSVGKDEAFKLTIPYAKYANLTVPAFVCVGESFPQDREQMISSKWEFRVKIFDAKYVPREKMEIVKRNGSNYLVLGEHALYARVFDDGKWSTYKKKTTVKLSGDLSRVQAYSESLMGRWNSYGY